MLGIVSLEFIIGNVGFESKLVYEIIDIITFKFLIIRFEYLNITCEYY